MDKTMTVLELIAELTEMVEKGHGYCKVSDHHENDIEGVFYSSLYDTVMLYTANED